LGISQQFVQKIESGKSKIDIDRAARIAKSLDLSLQALLDFQPANYVTHCEQGGIMNTYNFLNEKLLAQLEHENNTLKEALEFVRQQNRDLMEVLKGTKKR